MLTSPLRFAKLVGSMLLVACGPPMALDESSESKIGADETEDASAETTDEPAETTDDLDSSEPLGTEGTGLFLPLVDIICALPCDPFLQDCPDGEKCVAASSSGGPWDTNKCVPVTGSQAVGEPCSYGGPAEATDDCDQDGACWDLHDVDGEWVGICRAFCDGVPDDAHCAEGQGCLISNQYSVNYCLQRCDPLLQDCADGTSCTWATSDFLCTAITDHFGIGEPCQALNDCAEGLLCMYGDALPTCEGASCCTAYCDTGQGGGGCESLPGTTCKPFFESNAPPGKDHIGVCVI